MGGGGSRVAHSLASLLAACQGKVRACENRHKRMVPYAPVGIFLVVALAAALAFTILPGLLARRRPNPQKLDPYECGVEPTSAIAGRFPVRFYLIAMLFVVFDVEAASFYPWAVQMHSLRVFGLLEMVVFIVVLAIGYAYVWKKGGFQWR